MENYNEITLPKERLIDELREIRTKSLEGISAEEFTKNSNHQVYAGFAEYFATKLESFEFEQVSSEEYTSFFVDTIKEAVRLIGLKGIRNLVATFAAKNILIEQYSIDEVKEIMDHSYEVAFYAYEFAKKNKLNNLADDAYIGGILHDLGKIIVNSLKPGVLDNIKKICDKKGLNREILENLTSGYNHSIIGASLAERWNFPDELIGVIKHHHTPLSALDKDFDIVAIVYLANLLYYYKREEIEIIFIENKVLERFNIDTKEKLDKICQPIFRQFENKKKF